MIPPKHVTVLGGGLTGLTTAYRLTTHLPATKVTLIDSAKRTGGWIDSVSRKVSVPSTQGDENEKRRIVEGNVVTESGPRSIRPRGSPGAAGMLQLICDLGLRDDIIAIPKTHPSAKNRYILSPSNQLLPLSLNPFHSAISPSTILSASLEPFRSRSKPSSPSSQSSTSTSGDDDESVDSFLRRRFGPGVATLASAGLHGIYAASSTDLSAKTVLGRLYEWEKEYGSVIVGMIRAKYSEKAKIEKEEETQRWAPLGQLGKDREDWAMYGLKGGLGSLTGRLEKEIRARGVDVRLGEKVEGLEPGTEGIKIGTSSGPIDTSYLISSVSPPALSNLIPSISVPHSPRTSVGVITIILPLSPSEIHPAGFGYLIPRPSSPSSSSANPHGVLGVIFDSTALPGLDTATGMTKLTVMMGGPYWSTYTPLLPLPTSDTLPGMALEHLRTVFPVLNGVEPISISAKLHRDCIPTYSPGHATRTGQLHRSIQTSAWRDKLSLVGNGFGGVGVNDCVWSAENVVRNLRDGKRVTGLEKWALPDLEPQGIKHGEVSEVV